MKTSVPCPTCKKNAPWDENPYRPFCSERCKLIDLGHWLNEEYSIEAEPDESDLEQMATLARDPDNDDNKLH